MPEPLPWIGRTASHRHDELEATLARASRCRSDAADLRVSVIISTIDRAEYLERSLQALRHLRYPHFEVIVVEGPSSDTSADILDRWGSRIKRVACPVRNLSASRNLGIRAASGDLVAFIDDDAIAEADWLDRLVEPFGDPCVVATGGAIRNWSGIRFQSRALTVDRGASVRASTLEAIRSEGLCPALTGTNFCVRREAAIAAGMFDESYAYFLEESDMQRTLFEAGGKLVYTGRAEVHHMRAPNAHRDAHRVPTDYSRKLASVTYFCLKHRAGEDDRSVVVARVAKQLQATFEEVLRLRLNRQADRRTAAALIRSACRGLKQGAQLALDRPAGDPSDARPPVSRLPFRPFPALGGNGLRVAIIGRSSANEAGRIALETLCSALAAQGREVTLVTGRPQVWVAYLNCYWTHACLGEYRSLSAMPLVRLRRAWRELRRIDDRRAFDVVVDVAVGGRQARVRLLPFPPLRFRSVLRPWLRASMHRVPLDDLTEEVRALVAASERLVLPRLQLALPAP